MFRVLVAILCLCLSPLSLSAADSKNKNEHKKKDGYLAGKLYSFDKTTTLEGVKIRIVNVESGESRDTKSQEEGCYSFDHVKNGTYALSVNYKDKDYLLPEKVLVELRDREIAVATCVAINEQGSLELLDNCHICLGHGFPPLAIFVIGGTSATVGGIIIGQGKDPVASPSRPESH